MHKITSYGEILFDIFPGAKTLGGAPFNFIYHIKKLTGNGNFVSRIGNDSLGDEILNFLKVNDISHKFITIDYNHPTGTANANLDDNRIPHWKIENNCAYDFIELSGDMIDLIENETGCLYFGTLAQRNEISRETLNSLFGKNIKYFCDLNLRQNFYDAGILLTSLNTANVLKLNIDELKVVNDLIIKKRFDEILIAKSLSDNFNIDLVCITLGDEGAILYKEGDANHYKIKVENVIDTVGAGDAYASILCLGFLEGWENTQINKIASEFAAGIIQIKGALPKENKIYDTFKDKLLSQRLNRK
jgi:fructokinase